MPQADLEILISPHSSASYGLVLRFRHPPTGQDRSFSGSWTLDEAELLKRQYDAGVYGEQLAAQLFASPDARSFLDQTLAVAASQETPLHLRLFINAGAEALHSLRWETLRLPGSAAPLAASEWVRFSRYLDGNDWRPVRTATRDALRALIAVASPDVTGTTLAEVITQNELAATRAGLGDIPAVELAGRGQVTANNLLARLRDGCDILYLVAHGMIVDGEAHILLEREDGGRAWTAGRELAARLGELGQQPNLVVLVSCQSAGADGQWLSQDDGALAGLGPRLAAAGVPAVVAMQGNLTMDTAASFMPVFLTELRRDGQVDRAMAVARGAVRERPDWWMPVLFTRLIEGQLWAPSSPDALAEIPRQDFEPETVYIPSGHFLMGTDDPAAPAWEQPQHCVDLPAYRIGRKPVLVREYAVFIKQQKDHPQPPGWFNREPPAGRLDHPVTEVSWFDALAYCRWLSEANAKANARERQYTLPSEAQWERACGHDGVEDMLGALQQWTCSLWGSQPQQPDFSYPYDSRDGREITDPHDLPAQAWLVHRGGPHKSQPSDLRCTARGKAAPQSKPSARGFRVAMTLSTEGSTPCL